MIRLAHDLRRWRHQLAGLLRRRQGRHARQRGDTFQWFADVTQQTIPRKETSGHPPWETAQFPAVCLFPQALPTAA